MIQIKEENTHALTSNVPSSGLEKEDENKEVVCYRNGVDSMQNDIDIKPDATELLRVSLLTSECSPSKNAQQADLGNNFGGFQIKQEQLTSKYGPSASPLNIEGENQRSDGLFIVSTTEKQKSHISVPSTETGDKDNASVPKYAPNEEISLTTRTPVAHMVMTYSPLCESEARQWHVLTTDAGNSRSDVPHQKHRHVKLALIHAASSKSSSNSMEHLPPNFGSNLNSRPCVELCKIPNSVFAQDGSLKIQTPIVSKSMPAPLCWHGMGENSSLRHCSVSDRTSFPAASVVPVEDENELVTKTCAAFRMSVVDQLVFGCGELENDVAGKSDI